MKIKDLFKEANLVGKFERIHQGDISVDAKSLTSLGGSPHIVIGFFDCSDNQLSSLEGGPSEVHGDFHCSSNNLTSLQGAPRVVGNDFSGEFVCDHNKLTTLKGIPSEISGSLLCYKNELTTFDGFPEKIGGDLECWGNKFTTLKNIHKHIKQINGKVILWTTVHDKNDKYIPTQILGLLLIKGVTKLIFADKSVEKIVNNYLPNRHGMTAVFECQEELINAGFEEYAEL